MVFQEQDFLQYLRTTAKLSKGTIVTRRSRVNIFLTWLQETKKPLSYTTIEEFFTYLQDEKTLINSSLNTYVSALYTLEGYLLNRKLHEGFMNNYSRYSEEDPNIIPLSNEEIQRLKQACVQQTTTVILKSYYAITIFLIDTGARWEDGQALTSDCIDISGKQISYVQLKNKLQRVLPLDEPLLSLLEERMENGLVFTNSKGGKLHYPDYYQFLKTLAKHVGITKRVSPHIIRHSYAQNFYDLTGDIYLLKDLLGHKSINSTLRYVKNSQRKIKQAQQMHPHLADSMPPQRIIDIILKDLEKHKIENDTRFDYLQVKKAIHKFTVGLHEAIKPKIIDLNLP